MLLTTFQNEGSLSGKNCYFCNSVANCRCLDCSPCMSLCESCAVDTHKSRNYFHHVEVSRDCKMYFPLKIQRTLTYDHQCSNGVHFRPVMIVDSREGHALAKRLSKQITKATKSLKTSMDEYNKLECSANCSLPLTLAFDSVKDPDSDVWLEVNATGESRPAVPVTVMRKAVDLYSLMDRCREEITLLQSEMCNTVDLFTRQHQLLKSSLNDSLDNPSPESTGREIFIRRKLLSLESYLVYLKVLFDDHIENVTLPSLLFEDDLPSLPRQEDEIGIS